MIPFPLCYWQCGFKLCRAAAARQRLGFAMVEVPVRGAKSFLDLITIRTRAIAGRYDRA